MIFNEALCEKLILEEKMYAAHIVLKVMRGDFIVGKTTMEDWIDVLGSDDAYLIFRIIESNDNEAGIDFGGSSFSDVKECVKMMLYIQTGLEQSDDIVNLKCREVHDKITIKDQR